MSGYTVEQLMKLAYRYAGDFAIAAVNSDALDPTEYRAQRDASEAALRAALVATINAGAHRATPAAQPDVSPPVEACWCRQCNPTAWWMVLCPECGNKRCPRANSHDYTCTRSNEPGQPGSAYPLPNGGTVGDSHSDPSSEPDVASVSRVAEASADPTRFGLWIHSPTGKATFGPIAPTAQRAAGDSVRPTQEERKVTDINAMVDRFLSWELPKTFAPDCGISFDGRGPDARGYNKEWPVGTNLFTAVEAKQMLEHVLGGDSALRDALRNLLQRYVELVESGDAGNWDAEKEPEVIAARAALSADERVSVGPPREPD